MRSAGPTARVAASRSGTYATVAAIALALQGEGKKAMLLGGRALRAPALMALARIAEKVGCDVIAFCGVHFMAETAKILNPKAKVVVPDLAAGCSLADGCPADEFAAFIARHRTQHPDLVVVSYVNTSAAVKALTRLPACLPRCC